MIDERNVVIIGLTMFQSFKYFHEYERDVRDFLIFNPLIQYEADTIAKITFK